MNVRIIDLFCDIEVIKEKFEDLKSTHGWFISDAFPYNQLDTMEDVKNHGRRYVEQRIHCEQLFDLMHTYIEQFDEVIQKFHEIEKASSVKSANGTDNA
ncbi:pathogenicity island protein [Staphylococcus simulans]|uniref:type II toxin-antitoxin system toxin TscT n=1 Tax=Staphylococcus simulans TaxID=1286 RepID=UPI000D1D8E93|nr:DUF1474 family protein [Staphylococcus simulans]PTJ22257.1 pathogenicity island protein [Staphylococcus simulans]